MTELLATIEIEELQVVTAKVPLHHDGQVLLIHANSLNADAYPDLARMMRARGYRFVPLGEAIADPAFGSPDTFTGAGGISWLHRWALTRDEKGLVLPNEPVVPKFVLEIAGVDGE